MSEVASGADLLGGQGDAPPASDEGQGNAPESPWYGNQELSGYVENKGWKEAGQVVEGYQNLEKLLGDKANALIVPKEGDEQAWGDFYNRLGRPGNSGEYKFGGEESTPLTDWFKEAAYQNGLSQTQAATLFDAFNEFSQAGNEEALQAQEAKAQQDIVDLKKAWGNEYDTNIKAGQRAANRFGFTAEEMSGMESAVGTKAMLERFAQIGRALGEDSYQSGDTATNSFGLTPEVAQQQIKDLQMDATFQAAYLDQANPGHKAAKEKYTRLFTAAYPGGM